MVRWPVAISSPQPLMQQEPLHRIAALLCGIYTGNGPTENQTTRPSGGNSGLRCAIASFISVLV